MTTVSVRVEQNLGDWREGEIRILERTPRIDTMIEDGRLTVGNWFQSVEDPATNAVVEDLNTRAQAEAIANLVAPGDEGFAADVALAHAELAAAREEAETKLAEFNAELAAPRTRKRRRATLTGDGQPDEAPDA